MQVIKITGNICSDQTGRFPVTSSRGNKCIMVVYECHSNSMLTEPLKSRDETELVRTCSKIHALLVSRGLKLELNILDNKAPGKLKQFMHSQQVAFQLVPPHIHCCNGAERAISTFKDHFIATSSTTHSMFPLHLWCRLLDQATATLNLLRSSQINPKLSAEAQLNGPLITKPRRLLLQEPKFSPTRSPPNVGPALRMASKDGTLAQLQITTDAIVSTSHALLPNMLPMPSKSFPNMHPCPKHRQPTAPAMQPPLSPQLF
jgi:hypothetical protein